jgi:hypothetical protein
MRKLEQQQQNYQGRIERFKHQLAKVDPLWITKRSWFEDLNTFELGDNFYYKVFNVDDSVVSAEDKSNFYFGILIYASIQIKEKFGNKSEYLESGFEIEADLDDTSEKEQHESLLGYFWWLAIYKQAHKAKQFSETEESQLQNKRKQLMKQFNRIESLD